NRKGRRSTPASVGKAVLRLPAVAPGSALLLRLRLVHFHRPAVVIGAVQRIDRGLCLGGRRHFHEAEALALAGVTVRDDACRFDTPAVRELRREAFIGSGIGEIAYVKFPAHWYLLMG